MSKPINLKNYRLVTEDEKKKYKKPECAVFKRGGELPTRSVNTGFFSKASDMAYYVPLGFQFETGKECDYKSAVERAKDRIKKHSEDFGIPEHYKAGLEYALEIINEELEK